MMNDNRLPMQSPIDLDPMSVLNGQGKQVDICYVDGRFTVRDDGRGIDLKPDKDGENFILLDGERYDLVRIHTCCPGEHAINGTAPELELQFTHRSSQGQIAVLSLLVDKGRKNEAAGKPWTLMSGDSLGEGCDVSLTALLPQDLDNMQYEGSLTCEPYTEGVRWIVLERHAEAGEEQLDLVKKSIGGSARPLQLLHGRRLHGNRGRRTDGQGAVAGANAACGCR